ncbi:hypothetical protein BWP39_24665 [Paraburkholderia acidicola]|uniref:Uncharacterized protein n=1 Tax=Paraburkholderia acidicola TaxID=1912599 RepID=A0A2A4ER34_9BURK|nr:hypothetical protein [Paraburkholderia acidicola]PCE22878.1 hypothetical protein BWP39_24665 [Paraburkholderia acidicola]
MALRSLGVVERQALSLLRSADGLPGKKFLMLIKQILINVLLPRDDESLLVASILVMDLTGVARWNSWPGVA